MKKIKSFFRIAIHCLLVATILLCLLAVIVLLCLLINCLLRPPPNWVGSVSTIVSLIALLLTILLTLLYFVKPNLIIRNETNERQIRIRCTNCNYFPNTIKDVRCDVVLSKNENFNIVKTIKLDKDSIPGIKQYDCYIFKSRYNISKHKKYTYIKVRILAINILGVKKYYEISEKV